MVNLGKLQIGKGGLTDNFFMSLDNIFRTHNNVKISVLPSARESRDDVKKYSDKILKHLGPKYTARVIGFTIALKKWRKDKREE